MTLLVWLHKNYAKVTTVGMIRGQKDLNDDWKQWKEELELLKNFEIRKCFMSARFGDITIAVFTTSQMQAKRDMVKYHI